MTRRVLTSLVLALACAAPLPLCACMGATRQAPLAEPARPPSGTVPLANPLILGVH